MTEKPDDLAAVLEELCRAGVCSKSANESTRLTVFGTRSPRRPPAAASSAINAHNCKRGRLGPGSGSAERFDHIGAVFGRHYSMAGENDLAVHYLRVAAKHAVGAREEGIHV